MKGDEASSALKGSVMRECCKCKRDRIPEGGIETGPGKWKCVYCWRASTFKTKKEKTK